MQQGYQQPPPQQQQQYQQPPPQQPGYHPEADSIKSMLNIAGIFSLIIGILLLIGGVIWLVWTFAWIGGYAIFGLIFIMIPVIFGVVDILIFTNCKAIIQMVDGHQYQQAKSKTLVWMIIGFIFGGLIPGILILLAYLKFDPLIRAAQPNYYPPAPGQQQYQQPPPPQYQQQPPQQGQPPQY